VEAISRSPYWADSAILVVEDDAANGVDHVDGHRSPSFVISPYARRSFVDHNYYTQIDVVRTIEQILRLPPMNQHDLAATPMRTVFTDIADLESYQSLPNEIRLDEMNDSHATDCSRRALDLAPLKMALVRPRVPDTAEKLLNRAIWYANSDFARPYPGDGRLLLPVEVRYGQEREMNDAARLAQGNPPKPLSPSGDGDLRRLPSAEVIAWLGDFCQQPKTFSVLTASRAGKGPAIEALPLVSNLETLAQCIPPELAI
jgi:hypothetical protein